MSSEQEADRISRHVQPLRNQLDILRQKLVHLQNWTVAHPELPHPAAVGGEMNWYFKKCLNYNFKFIVFNIFTTHCNIYIFQGKDGI